MASQSARLNKRIGVEEPRNASQGLGAHWGKRLAVVGVTLFLVLPLIISALSLIGKRYTPIGDQAAMIYRIQQVGTRQTPLIGVYSTHGWAHPGPAIFYLFAVPYRVFGSRIIVVFMAAALFNALCVGLTTYLAWRRRRALSLVVIAVIMATLLHGLRPDTLIQIWNPYVPLLLYLAFLLTLWGLAEEDRALLPLAALLATLIIQMHVSYVPLVVAGAVTVILLRRVQRRAAVVSLAKAASSTNRMVWVLVGVLWLPVVIDLFFGSHNLYRVARYFTAAHQVTGLSTGLGLLSGHVGAASPWTGGHERVVFANVLPEGLAALLLLVLLVLASCVVELRRDRSAAALPILAAGQLLAGAIAATRVEAPVFSYLIVWMLPLAAFCWAAIAMSGVEVLLAKIPCQHRRGAWRAVIALGVVLATIQTARTTAVASSPPLPVQQYASGVKSVLEQLLPQLQPGEAIRVEGAGDTLNEPWVGVLFGISQHDQNFFTTDGAAGRKWGGNHVWRGQAVTEVLTVAVTVQENYQDAVARCQSQPGERRLAFYDRLSPADRRLLLSLLTQNYAARGHLSKAVEARIVTLNAKAFRIGVFAGRQPCGS